MRSGGQKTLLGGYVIRMTTFARLASQQPFVLALILMSTPAWSQATTEAARLRPILPFTQFTLDNGLTVIVREDHKLPIVSVEVVYQAGSRNDPPGKSGLAHLFEHLLFYGSQHHPRNFLVAMQKLGGTNVNGGTGPDLTTVYRDGRRSRSSMPCFGWNRTGWATSCPPSPRRRSTNRSSSSATRSIWVGTNPGEMCATTLRPASFRRTIPIIRNRSAIRRNWADITLDDARNFFKTYYAPSNAAVVIAGDITPSAGAREGQTLFRRLADRPAPRSNDDVGTRAQPGQARAHLRRRPAEAVPLLADAELRHDRRCSPQAGRVDPDGWRLLAGAAPPFGCRARCVGPVLVRRRQRDCGCFRDFSPRGVPGGVPDHRAPHPGGNRGAGGERTDARGARTGETLQDPRRCAGSRSEPRTRTGRRTCSPTPGGWATAMPACWTPTCSRCARRRPRTFPPPPGAGSIAPPISWTWNQRRNTGPRRPMWTGAECLEPTAFKPADFPETPVTTLPNGLKMRHAQWQGRSSRWSLR